MAMRSALARAKGLGSAKEGVGHWWHQRLTALALAPLMIWLCTAIARLPSADYETVTTWIGFPLNAVMLVTVITAVLYHGYLGVQVIMEDYVNPRWVRTALIIISGFAAFLLGVSAIFVVLRLAFAS